MGIRDSRFSAPRDRYGVTGRQYPTPNIFDAIIVEDGASRFKEVYASLMPGTPHPDDPNSLLVWKGPIKGSNNEVAQRLVYCSTRNAQDAYNARIGYMDEGHLFPIFERTYFLPRAGYTPDTEGTALTCVTGLTLVTGGAGYVPDVNGRVALTFTGGSGTGAAGYAQVVKGVIVALLLTAGGTGYTSAPTVGFSGSPSLAATATAIIQPTTCLLTHQQAAPEEGEFASLFLRVGHTYETLPGPEIATTHFDKETATDQTTYRQRVAIGTAANPVSAIKIASASVATATVITLDYPHGLANASTFPVRIAGALASTPALDGDYTATITGANTLTVPVHITVAPTANTGYLSFLKGGQVIIESYVKPDDNAGKAAGTLITVCATLPGRELSDPEYDEERAASINEFRQYVVTGTASRTAGATYKSQTIEKSDCSNRSEGPAMSLLVTKTILLPGDPIVTPFLDEETGAKKYLIRTRVALPGTPATIGSVYIASPATQVQTSKVVAENVVVGVLTTTASELPPSRVEAVPGSEPMPREFGNTITGWVFSGDGYQIHGPFLGVNYTLVIHPDATPLLAFVTYTFGRDMSTITQFSVKSHRSRFLPIDGYMIHPGFTLTETNSIPTTQDIEVMPVSVIGPGDYSPGTIYDLTVHEHPIEGGELGIWERRTIAFVATA